MTKGFYTVQSDDNGNITGFSYQPDPDDDDEEYDPEFEQAALHMIFNHIQNRNKQSKQFIPWATYRED